MPLPVAVQLYSVRDSLEADFIGTLKQIKEMGYDGVEFAGTFGYSAEYLKGILDTIGLKAVSAHVPLIDLICGPVSTLSYYAQIGCKYVAIPYITEERRPGAENFYSTLEEIAMVGEFAKNPGVTLLYHNHDFEFKKIDGEIGLDVMYNTIPANLLQTELDTCWVNIGGEVPADYIRKYTGRAPVVHLKDFHIEGKLPKHLYKLIGLEEEENADDSSSFEFRPVGHGMQDIPAILEASVDAGAEWVVVEQDEPSMNLSRMECIKASRDYLKSLGW